jgi:hypothetical protein
MSLFGGLQDVLMANWPNCRMFPAKEIAAVKGSIAQMEVLVAGWDCRIGGLNAVKERVD